MIPWEKPENWPLMIKSMFLTDICQLKKETLPSRGNPRGWFIVLLKLIVKHLRSFFKWLIFVSAVSWLKLMNHDISNVG